MTKLLAVRGASRGASAYPQIRFVALAEIGTHVLFGTQMAGCTTCEIALSRTVLPLLSRIFASERDWRHKTNGATVRVIDYRLDGVVDAEPVYRLVTTILDHEKAPASELAALYHERWEIETAFDELKTHLRGARIVLRSKTPDLVRQEFYGLLMAHFAVRGLMHDAALKADEDPDQLSFLHAIRIVRRKLPVYGAIPPSAEKSLS